MGLRKRGAVLAVLASVVVLATWHLAPSRAQQVTKSSATTSQATRVEIAVVQSFDARYLGDTPGHIAHGRIGKERPDVAIGDPVYHGDKLIGKVTGVIWDRTKESIEVEFDPEPFQLDNNGRPAAPNRVAVGLDVWIPMGGSRSASTTKEAAPRR